MEKSPRRGVGRFNCATMVPVLGMALPGALVLVNRTHGRSLACGGPLGVILVQ